MEQEISIFGSRVKYWVFNTDCAPTIIMVHGFRGTHHGLLDVIRHLPGTQVIVPDLPGFGASTPMTARRHDIIGYRDFIEAFMQQVAPKKTVLLGHSFGSIVAAAVAAHVPKTINKLILINPIVTPARQLRFSSPVFFFYWLGNQLPERSGRALLSNSLFIKMMGVMLRKTTDPALRKKIHQNHLQHFSTFHTRQILSESFAASAGAAASHYAVHILTPTLLITGQKDAMAPLAGQRAFINQLANGTLVILPDVGHLIHYEKPAQAAAAIKHFMQS